MSSEEDDNDMMEDSESESSDGEFDNHSPLAKSTVSAGTVAFTTHSISDIKTSQAEEMVFLIISYYLRNTSLASSAANHNTPPHSCATLPGTRKTSLRNTWINHRPC
jgi:hypothetical protein